MLRRCLLAHGDTSVGRGSKPDCPFLSSGVSSYPTAALDSGIHSAWTAAHSSRAVPASALQRSSSLTHQEALGAVALVASR